MKRLALAATMAVLAALGGGCASEVADDDSSDGAIVGGSDAKSAAYDAVGTIGWVYGDDPAAAGAFDAFCTGTLIAPDEVVTAKHCAQDSTAEAPYVKDRTVAFAIGSDAGKPKRVVKAKDVTLTAPNEGGFIGFGADVAIYKLSERVTGVTPAKLVKAGLDARHLPASWAATPNALEGLAFLAKDAVLVVDDFNPTGAADPHGSQAGAQSPPLPPRSRPPKADAGVAARPTSPIQTAVKRHALIRRMLMASLTVPVRHPRPPPPRPLGCRGQRRSVPKCLPR